MNKRQLFEQIKQKESFLCVGLDTDLQKIPKYLLDEEDPVFCFNQQIIEATAPFAVAYKPNLAFYESNGIAGMKSLEKTVNYVRNKYPEIFLIADAKRGDIGNTSAMYARTFFEIMEFDAVTIAPYMGEDSVSPFLDYQDKWVILLALTSNKGAFDFQFMSDQNGEKLFEKVLRISQQWADDDKMMYVVGATKAQELEGIRNIVPKNFLLVPGVGAQGGSLEEVAKFGMNDHCGLLVNSSRAILYASDGNDFAEKAGKAALEVQIEMRQLLIEKGLI